MHPRFSKVKVIGRGVYGEVSSGYDRELRKQVAIKTFRSSSGKGGVSSLIMREISLLKACDHPNIIKVLDCIIYSQINHPTKIYLVVELEDTNLLLFHKHHQQTITLATCHSIIRQILDAVSHLHSRSIMHRDLKLDNILISRSEPYQIKVADMGLARAFIPTSTAEQKTLPMQAVSYAAPEVLLGDPRYTQAIDVFSVGCIFGELLRNDLEAFFSPRQQGPPVDKTIDNPSRHSSVSTDSRTDRYVREESGLSWLSLVFAVLGTPTREIAPHLSMLPGMAKVAPCQSAGAVDASTTPTMRIYAMLDPRLACRSDAILLTLLLALDPQKRIGASAALRYLHE
jgi:serine/threonine protein kinase